MSDPATAATTASTITPYITAFATISAPLITAISLNYATQNRRAERTKALIENKVALAEKDLQDSSTKEIQAALDEIILLTLQADINKSTKLTWKQIIPRVNITLVLLAIGATVTSLYLSLYIREDNQENNSVVASIISLLGNQNGEYVAILLGTITSAIAALVTTLFNSSINRISRKEFEKRIGREQEMQDPIFLNFESPKAKKDTYPRSKHKGKHGD